MYVSNGSLMVVTNEPVMFGTWQNISVPVSVAWNSSLNFDGLTAWSRVLFESQHFLG